jgi:hypothetical protein
MYKSVLQMLHLNYCNGISLYSPMPNVIIPHIYIMGGSNNLTSILAHSTTRDSKTLFEQASVTCSLTSVVAYHHLHKLKAPSRGYGFHHVMLRLQFAQVRHRRQYRS